MTLAANTAWFSSLAGCEFLFFAAISGPGEKPRRVRETPCVVIGQTLLQIGGVATIMAGVPDTFPDVSAKHKWPAIRSSGAGPPSR